MRAISSLEVFLCSKAKICDLCCEVNCLYISNTKLVNLRETSVSLFILYCQYVLLLSALGGGLGRPRRLGIPSPEGERRMTNAHLKVLHFDLESSNSAIFMFSRQSGNKICSRYATSEGCDDCRRIKIENHSGFMPYGSQYFQVAAHVLHRYNFVSNSLRQETSDSSLLCLRLHE